MNAIALTLGLFAFATLAGCGVTVAMLRRELGVADVLLAPATGFAVIIVLVVPLNRGGLPVNAFAAILAAVLAGGAAFAVARHWKLVRPALARCAPFAGIALVALVLIAGPMLAFGFNWFSYSNEDGVNYSLSAERLRVVGFYAVPDYPSFVNGRDISTSYFLLNAVSPERYGVDELLAFVSALARLDALRALMPLLVSLHLAGVAALGALCYRGRRPYLTALAAAGLLAISPLQTFGVLYQLAGQVAGLLFLTAGVARACEPAIVTLKGYARFAELVLAGVLLAAQAESYPELAPFGALTIFVYHVVRNPRDLRTRLGLMAGLTVTCALILNVYLRNVACVLAERVGAPSRMADVFPYYLLPSGIANLAGFLPVGSFPADPWLSADIAAGLIYVAAALAATAFCIRRDEPVGILGAIFAVSAVAFFHQHEGFALYKIAMYVQPAFCGALASLLVVVLGSRPHGVRFAAALCGSVVVAFNVATQTRYVVASRASPDSKVASFVVIPNVGGARTFDVLGELRTRLSPGDLLASDTYNQSLAKIESFYARDFASVTFPSEDVADPPFNNLRRGTIAWSLREPEMSAIGTRYAQGWRGRFSQRTFPVNAGLEAQFVRDRLNRLDRTRLWVQGSQDSPFNRLALKYARVTSVDPHSANVLVFVGSTLGHAYFLHRDPTAVYQMEHDYFGSGDSMVAVGRYLLFEVLNPTRAISLHIAFTETLRADGANVLPPASVIGTSRVDFELGGRGSASVFSGPVTPRVIDGHAYILLDMGAAPVKFRYARHGLMRLWGGDVEIDPRPIAGFLREFSAVDAAAVSAPSAAITAFPQGLLSPAAQYAGLYEDGWASERVATKFSVGRAGAIELRGVVPLIDDPKFSSDLRVDVDGMTALSEPLHVGDVDVRIPVTPGIHRITWSFSRYQRLPGGDRRIVAMLVRRIGSVDLENSR